MAQTIRLVRQYESVKTSGSRPITMAASTNQNRRDARMVPNMPSGGAAAVGLDIFFPLLGDQSSRPHRECQQEQGEYHDVDQTRIEELRGVALD
jgi:hypothetical protein